MKNVSELLKPSEHFSFLKWNPITSIPHQFHFAFLPFPLPLWDNNGSKLKYSTGNETPFQERNMSSVITYGFHVADTTGFRGGNATLTYAKM